MPEFRTIITAIGQTKIGQAIATQTPLLLTEMAIGDSDGEGYDPDENQVALVNELYRDDFESVEVSTGGVIVLTMTIPITEGGWHIREAGVFDDEGDLIAVVRIADRYKPLPSSGQADDLSIVLKLDVGNVGAVTWAIDPLKKIHHGRMLRTFFQVVDTLQSTPPSDPEPGATHIVGSSPTGAWVGRQHWLAQWTGVGWSMVDVPAGHIVRIGDSNDYRYRTVSGWDNWLASETLVGPTQLATLAQTIAGTANNVAVTPQGLRKTPAVFLRGDRVGSQSIASNTMTLLTTFSPVLSKFRDPATVFNNPSGTLTIGPLDAGWWVAFCFVQMGVVGGSTLFTYVHKNGGPEFSQANQRSSNGTAYSNASGLVRLEAGDTLAGYVYQNHSAAQTLENARIMFYRVGDL